MVLCFVKCNPAAVLNVSQHLLREIDMSIQAGTNCGPADCELTQNVDRFFGARFSISDLLRVTGEFLAEPDRRRVHQMRAADFDDVPKFLRFGVERAMESVERRNQ